MPRSLVLGNGNMLATFDDFLQLRDFYYPYVGMEDHTTYGKFHRVGFFTDGKLSWTNDGSWEITIKYHADTLVSDSVAINRGLGLKVKFEDFVYTTHDILFRKITVHNLSDRAREVKVFFHHDFHIFEDKAKDTAQYEPDLKALIHYRQNRYFLISGKWAERGGEGMRDFAVGKIGCGGLEGTYKDAEDGILSGNPVEQGSVDSTSGFGAEVPPNGEKTLFMWVIAGRSYENVKKSHRFILRLGFKKIFDHVRLFWQEWLRAHHLDLTPLPEEIALLFNRSLLTIRTQTDNRGAIIAANDSDNMRVNRDTYTYMWPRDGALVALSLIAAGYEVPARRFLTFCKNVITEDGFMLHKYNPDGTPGSTWHPKLRGGATQLPIQEDETALILVAMDAYYQRFGIIETVQEGFQDLALNIGNWMTDFIDAKTGLPLPTYDLWEEQHGVFSYTTACIYAGLCAASSLAKATGHLASSRKFHTAAEKISRAALKHLYDPATGRFVKKLILENGEIISKDTTVDASLAFIWKMKLVSADDARAISTMRAIKDKLTIPGQIGGIARYENDNYHFDWDLQNHDTITGNPWIITTLWTADYMIETAKTPEDLAQALDILKWASARANSSGMLPEQVHPISGRPISVSPLTWSHAAYVETVIRYLKKKEMMR